MHKYMRENAKHRRNVRFRCKRKQQNAPGSFILHKPKNKKRNKGYQDVLGTRGVLLVTWCHSHGHFLFKDDVRIDIWNDAASE